MTHLFKFHVLLDVLTVLLFKFAKLSLKLVTLFHFTAHAVNGRLGILQFGRSLAQYVNFVLVIDLALIFCAKFDSKHKYLKATRLLCRTLQVILAHFHAIQVLF